MIVPPSEYLNGIVSNAAGAAGAGAGAAGVGAGAAGAGAGAREPDKYDVGTCYLIVHVATTCRSKCLQ